MGTIDWETIDPKPEGKASGKGGSRFLRLEANKSFRIRPVGKPFELRQYYADGKYAITGEEGDNCIIQQKYRNADGDPEYPQRTKFAFNCLDRNDVNEETGLARVKIVQVPPTVARVIRDWAKEMGVNPGSGQGADFKISVTREGSDARSTRYQVIPLGQIPFTDEEKAFLKKDGVYKLEEVFAPVPQDEIEAALGLAEETVGAASGSSEGSSGDDLDF